mgnify:CR=1 FL=1
MLSIQQEAGKTCLCCQMGLKRCLQDELDMDDSYADDIEETNDEEQETYGEYQRFLERERATQEQSRRPTDQINGFITPSRRTHILQQLAMSNIFLPLKAKL